MPSRPSCRSTRRREAFPFSEVDHGDSTNDPLGDLRFIRETIHRSSAFTAVPGWGQVVIGVTAMAAAVIASRQLTPSAWTLTWLAEACLALAIASMAMNIKSQQLGVPLISGPGRKFLLGFLPPLVAGALITLLLYPQA